MILMNSYALGATIEWTWEKLVLVVAALSFFPLLYFIKK
jgi:hypothetical protein